MQKLKINLLKLHGVKQFTSKEGTDFIAIPIAANNLFVNDKSVYLDATALENKEGKDRYQNDGFITLDIPKEAREAGEKGPIIGNWKHIQPKAQSGKVNLKGPKNRPPVDLGDPDNATDDIPF